MVTLSSCQSTASPDGGYRHWSNAPLHAVPAPPTGTAGHGAVCLALGPSEWALLVPPLAPPQDGRTPRPPSWLPGNLAGLAVRPLSCRFALVRTPGPADPSLGLAVLHHRRGLTCTYCPRTRIAAPAGRVLSALIAQVMDGAADPPPRITVRPVEHSQLPLHPAAAIARGRDVTGSVCSDLISAELAGVLGVRWTAHAWHLFQRREHTVETPVSPAG